MLFKRNAITMVTTLAIGLALAACGSPSATASSGSSCSSIPTVTSHGQGSASGTPDVASVELAVQTQQSTASAALAQNSSDTNNLIKTLFANGISKSDVQTSGLSLHGIYGGSTPAITGYQVTNTVTVRIQNIGSTGKVIDSAANAAGNAIRINQIAFSVKDSSVLFGQARAAAVSQAATEAKAMAQAAGKHLGALCSLNDSAPSSGPQKISSSYSLIGSPTSVPIQTGSQRVNVTVTAVYQLQP